MGKGMSIFAPDQKCLTAIARAAPMTAQLMRQHLGAIPAALPSCHRGG
jgi:hypothetical protein